MLRNLKKCQPIQYSVLKNTFFNKIFKNINKNALHKKIKIKKFFIFLTKVRF